MNPLKSSIDELFKEFDNNKEALLKDYFDFLSFKSISSEPEFQTDVAACASWLVKYLEDSGLQVEIWPTSGHPVIFASWMGAGSAQPTVLIYNHYDVQPVDPLELWQSPPFDPTIRNGEVYARGAEDNKGQCFYVISAIRTLLKKNGRLPVNLKLCIEGEEETGSAGLAKLLETKRSELAADYLYIVDLGLHEAGKPALTLGIRGITTMTVELQGSAGDLHSGTHGGMVYNPNKAMAELLSKLHDSSGAVAIPGFYEDVLAATDEEMKQLCFELDDKDYQSKFGTTPVGREIGFSPLQSAWIRPTLEINGIGGGYIGDGFKTVIPGKTIAKISCRLVPKQKPEKIGKLVENFLRKNTPQGVEIKVHLHPGVGDAVRSSPDCRPVQKTAEVFSEIFKKPCQFILSGGSIPIAAGLSAASGAEIVMMGYGLPDDNIHAPNEHFGIDRIRMGFATIGGILGNLSK